MYLILFLLGSGVGSFLNVITLRYSENGYVLGAHVVYGRSHCLHCGKTLRWYELVPLLSFILQLGRCRSCKVRLTLQYPIVELLTALTFIFLPYYFFVYQKTLYLDLSDQWLLGFSALWILVFLGLLTLGIIDYRKYLVPDEIIVFLAVLGIVWTIFLALSGHFGEFYGSFIGEYAALFGLKSSLWLNHILGSVLGALLIGAIFFGTRGKGIGFGDVKLFGALGILFGWPDIILVFFFSFIVGAAFSIPLLIRRLKGMKDFVPFAPFIALASLLVFYFGHDIMRMYFSLFSFS